MGREEVLPFSVATNHLRDLKEPGHDRSHTKSCDFVDLAGTTDPRSSPIVGTDVRPTSNRVGATYDVQTTVVDQVEGALADAITKAAAAGEWGTVEALTRELRARREARASVVELAAERKRGGG